MMRKQLFLVGLLSCIFLLGCKKEEKEGVVNTLTVPSEQEKEIALISDELSTKISFDASDDWKIDIYDGDYNYYLPPDNNTIGWLKLSEESGVGGHFSLDVTLTENMTYDVRQAYIKVISGELSVLFKIMQDCKSYFICKDVSVSLTSKKSEFVVPIKYNKSDLYAVEIPKEVDWISHISTKKIEDGVIRFSAKENVSENIRRAEIKIIALNQEHTVSILQLGKKTE